MRIEGLWGSPPPPVWPGSPQTAVVFVGLPLLIALVLLAAPLHDGGLPPPPLEEVAVSAGPSTPEPRVRHRETDLAAMPRAVVKRDRADGPVPAVIHETRRTVHRQLPYAGEAIRLRPARTDVSATASSLGTQSP